MIHTFMLTFSALFLRKIYCIIFCFPHDWVTRTDEHIHNRSYLYYFRLSFSLRLNVYCVLNWGMHGKNAYKYKVLQVNIKRYWNAGWCLRSNNKQWAARHVGTKQDVTCVSKNCFSVILAGLNGLYKFISLNLFLCLNS